jgi:hypothetical protein
MSTPEHEHGDSSSSAVQLSPLIDNIISTYERSDGVVVGGGGGGRVDGILVNDANGLCLVSKGMTSTTTTTAKIGTNGNSTGVYTSLTRLASVLTPHQQALKRQQELQSLQGEETTEEQNPKSASARRHSATIVSAPLITIETDGSSPSRSSSSSILVKEYENKYTVALRVTSSNVDTTP